MLGEMKAIISDFNGVIIDSIAVQKKVFYQERIKSFANSNTMKMKPLGLTIV